jgi:hypothetical protein
MVMMAGALAAMPVERLPVGAEQDIDIALLGHRLQRPVDRREANILAAGAKHVVQVLSGSEVVKLLKHVCHRGALAR